MQLAMKKIDDRDLKRLENKRARMKAIVEEIPPSAEKFFLEDNEFHDIITDMGQNPLVDKINQVVRVLTHSMRMRTVENMLKSGRGAELYEAHEEIYMMLKNRVTENMNQAVRRTYFSEVAFEEI